MIERTKELIGGALAWACSPLIVVAVLWVVGTAVETIGQHDEEHQRCLHGAANGLEIKRCR